MLGKMESQRNMFDGPDRFREFVGETSFYVYVADNLRRLFPDERFAGLYSKKRGRPSVPPSRLAGALLLQTLEGLSDQAATDHAAFDLRWKVALDVLMEERPFAKSTLQLFRAQLVLHEEAGLFFEESVREARRSGHLKGGKSRVVVDTTPVLGRGAVKDTFNLLADSIERVIRELARCRDESVESWAEEQGLSRYLAASFKGAVAIDWDDEGQRKSLLRSVVADADRVLGLVRVALQELPEELGGRLKEQSQLLSQLLAQDIERDEEGQGTLRRGVARDRQPSGTDPEVRHGRKSSSTRFDGHKASIAVDAESQVITAVEVLPGNAPDAEGVLELVKQSQEVSGCEVSEVVGDCAYSSGETRAAFEEAGIPLTAKVPRQTNGGRFPKSEFQIDLDNDRVVCPAGQVSEDFSYRKVSQGKRKKKVRVKQFRFSTETCQSCPLRDRCVGSKSGKGRTITLNAHEHLLQQARAAQGTPEFREAIQARQVAEHRLARLRQLGAKQARYFGRTKTRFQLFMTAAVANLTLIWNRCAAKAQRTNNETEKLARCDVSKAVLRLASTLVTVLVARTDISERRIAEPRRLTVAAMAAA